MDSQHRQLRQTSGGRGRRIYISNAAFAAFRWEVLPRIAAVETLLK